MDQPPSPTYLELFKYILYIFIIAYAFGLVLSVLKGQKIFLDYIYQFFNYMLT